MVHVIGVSGKKRAGKDHAYQEFKALEYCSIPPIISVERLSFGDGLKEEIATLILKPIFGITFSQSLDESMRDTLRPLWQVWGTEIRRQLSGEDYWVQKVRQQIQSIEARTPSDQCTVVVITDVRFQNELDFILEQPYHSVVRVDRRGCGLLGWLKHLLTKRRDHVSECELDHIPRKQWDFYVRNNKTVEDYNQKLSCVALEIHERIFEQWCARKYLNEDARKSFRVSATILPRR